ncbi:unnamed protein product [Rotaria magnacalcarata]|uniref:Integrase catalytic domain-containing protein n=1 Tax=Rotaria magnacalcarata TaxID=392030 RepID=A0A816X620_9BILA|nr:unnamed protein product [Rotaria magnacalcarata]CAF4260014.1 unnamed protein product [Rotaria magnacalcarata]
MFHKKIDKIKNNYTNLIDEILIENNVSEKITIKHSNLEVKIDRLDRRFTNDFRSIHDSLPLESFKTYESVKLNNICDNSVKYNVPDNILQCNHKNHNHSMAYINYELLHCINYCALFDTCSSINLMSETLANFLLEQNHLTWDETKPMNIVCSGGKEIKVNMKFAYAHPYIGDNWSFHSVKFGVVKDDIIPCCCIFGFEFMTKNHIKLNFNKMTVDMDGEHLALLGIYNKNSNLAFQPDYNNCEYIFKDEIKNFDNNIEKLPIEIISTYKKLFTKDLLNLKIKQLLKDYDYTKAPPHIKKLIEESSNVTTEHCAVIASNELICTKPIINFQNNLDLPEITKNKFILENFQKNYRDTSEYKTMEPKMRLYCDLSHEKILKLYNDYLKELQNDPNVTKQSLNIPEEIDHVRIPALLNFDLISKLNFIDNPKSSKLLIKTDISKIGKPNSSAYVKQANKYSIIPDYVKLKSNLNYFGNEDQIIDNNTESSTLEIIRISTLNKPINTPTARKSLLNSIINNGKISYKERNALLQEKFNLNNLNFDVEIRRTFKTNDDIINMQNNDSVIKDLKDQIQFNKHGTWKNLKKFHTAKKNLFICNDVLIWYRPHDNKILPVVSKNFLISIIISYHNKNHEGSSKILNRLKKYFYYPGIEYITTETIACCYICQTQKPHIGVEKPKLPSLKVEAENALDHCMADLTFLTKCNGYIGIFVIIDIASRRCFAEKIKNKSSAEVIKAFDKIIKKELLGFNIKTLRVDNGTEFTSNEFKDYCKSIGTKLTFGNVFSSRAGGKVERLNGIIKQLIKVQITKDNPSKWVDHFDNAIYTYNTSPHSALGNKSPFEMFIKLSNNLNNPIPLNDNERKNLIESQPNFPYFKVGDLVLKKIDRIGRQSQDSMKPYYDGPYKIIEEAEHRKSFTLTTIHGITKRSHYDKLKKFKEPPEWLKRNVDFQKYLWTKFPTYYKESNNIENEQYYYKHDNKYHESDNSRVKSPPQNYHKDYYYTPDKKSPKIKEIFSNPRKQLLHDRVNMSWHSSDDNHYDSDEGEIIYFTPAMKRLEKAEAHSNIQITPNNQILPSFNNLISYCSPILRSPVSKIFTTAQCNPNLGSPLKINSNSPNKIKHIQGGPIEIKRLPNLSQNNMSYLLSHPAINSSNIEISSKIKTNIIKDFITITENEELNLNKSLNSIPGETDQNINLLINNVPVNDENIPVTNNDILSRGQLAVRRKTKLSRDPAPSIHPMTTRRKTSI